MGLDSVEIVLRAEELFAKPPVIDQPEILAAKAPKVDAGDRMEAR